MKRTKPIKISPELAARCERADGAERMDKLFRAVIAVPHSAIAEQEKKWQRERKPGKTPKAH